MSPIILDAYLHKMAFFNILGQLAELGHNTSLVAVRSRIVPQLDNRKVQLVAIPLRSFPIVTSVMFTIVTLLFLPILTILSKSDIVIFSPDFTFLSSLPGLFISKFKKTKFVLDIRSVPVETEGFQGFLQKFWFNLSVLIAKRMFHGITIITPLMKKEICDSFNLNPDNVGVWTSGVSDELFNPSTLDRESLKRKFGLTDNFVVFYHGVFTATRGLTQTIEAVKILKRKYPKIIFLLLGTGPIVNMLRSLVKKEGLEQNIVINDPVDQVEVPNFIRMCDVGIVPLPDHPYWRSQSPLKLLEYLAMEKVVILTDIPAHRSVIGEAKCGIYISTIEPIEIAKAIEYAYLNKVSLHEWGRIGREIVKKKYTWEKVALDLQEYLLSI